MNAYHHLCYYVCQSGPVAVMHHYPIEVVLLHYKKMVAVTTLYGPTEMIDGGFLWVKRCWALAVARGLLDGGIPWFSQKC